MKFIVALTLFFMYNLIGVGRFFDVTSKINNIELPYVHKIELNI